MNQNRSPFGQSNETNNGPVTGWNPNGMNSYQQPQGYPNMNQQPQYVPPTMNFQQPVNYASQTGYVPTQGTANGYSAQNGNASGYVPPVQGGMGTYGTPMMNQGYQQNPNGSYTGPIPALSQQQGSYIPQTPYSQPAQNNNAQNGVPNGYNPNGYMGYNQMGRNAGNPGNGYTNNGYTNNGYTGGYGNANQMPLNGGGYVPQQPPIRKRPFVFDDMKLILLGAVLLALFAVGMLVKNLGVVKYVFAALSVASIILFWVKPLIDDNKRLCFSVVFAVLTILALIPFGGSSSGDPTNANRTGTTGSNNVAAPVAVTANPFDTNSGSVTEQQPSQQMSDPFSNPTNSPAPDNDTATTDQLQSFFYFWAVNKTEEMLSLCSPSWQSSVESPKTTLFGILANRTPLNYTIEKISGTVDDSSRTVTLTAEIDRNNGKTPTKYRLNVLMVKEGGNWFVDPSSLKTYDSVETTEPPSATPTYAPASADANTVLYYNPNGGSKYHLDQNCISTNARYLPLKGSFKYSQVNESAYAELAPCNVCNAPLR